MARGLALDAATRILWPVCPGCGTPRRRAVTAGRRETIWVEPEPSEFGHVALERPAHGGRDIAYPLQGLELAEARAHGDPLHRQHLCDRGKAA